MLKQVALERKQFPRQLTDFAEVMEKGFFFLILTDLYPDLTTELADFE